MVRTRAIARHLRGALARRSNVGKWDRSYKDVMEASPYGDDTTYGKGAEYLRGLFVEDWGCGVGGMRRFVEPDLYRGIDGSHSRFADEIVDLATYRSNVEAVFMRHVIEHNRQWKKVLDNALASFERRMVLILFTPFVRRTHAITFQTEFGVPDIAFSRRDIVDRLPPDVSYQLEEGIETNTQYGVEHVFYLERSAP